MAFLENRCKYQKYQSKNIILALVQLLIRSQQSIYTALMIFFSIYIIYFSNQQLIQLVALENSGKVFKSFSLTIDYIVNSSNKLLEYFKSLENLRQENIELKLKLQHLQNVEQKLVHIISENKRLKKFINFTDETFNDNSITTRLLSVSSANYNKIGIISAGINQGVKQNNIVYDNHGLIGRIIEVSDNYSKVLLLTDINFKVPVISFLSQERAVIAGGGEHSIKALYLEENSKVQIGELFITSGDGKYYPYGIAVAQVSNISPLNSVYLTPCINLNKTEFVKVKLSN